jgi:hypothetical protein
MHQPTVSFAEEQNVELTSRGMVPLVAGISKITTAAV